MFDEIAASPAALFCGDVMGREAAADDELGQNGDEIILVPILVGVAEDEIEQAARELRIQGRKRDFGRQNIV